MSNETRGPLNVITNDPIELNALFQRIRDELDEIQGLRGRAMIYDRAKVGTPTETDDAAQLQDIPGTSSFVVMGDDNQSNEILSTRSLRFVDANGTLIHSIGTSD